jgi:hypothetical protein
MKTPLILLLAILFPLSAQSSLRFVENTVFGPGERFVFSVKYGIIPGGFAKLEITDTVRVRGALCHEIRSIAYSNNFLSVFFPVRDTNFSYMDVSGLYSLKVLKFIREGSYKRFRWTFFEPGKNRANTKDSIIPTKPFVQDIISAFYYLRVIGIRDSVDINTFDDYKNYALRIYVKKRQTVKTKAGRFKCLKLEPRLMSSGIFLKKGKMWVWVTDDERLLPVMLKFKLPFLGHITCKLVKYGKGSIVPQKGARP